MKKKIIAGIIAIILAFVLFFPFRIVSYDDGGTRDYGALTYRVVSWARYMPVYDESGEMVAVEEYSNSTVYWFPHNFKSIEELWLMETEQKG